MRKATIHGLLAAAAVSLPLITASPVRAASIQVCRAYGDEAVEAAKKVRELKCGFDLNHPQWSLEGLDHRQWCQASSNESVDHENVERRGQIYRCSECRTYATLAAFQARQNREMKCGFAGPAWNEDSEVHFGWCMGLTISHKAGLFFPLDKPLAISTDPQEAARSQALEECRARQEQKACKGCHAGASQVSGAPALLRKLSTGTGADKINTSSPRSAPAALRSGTPRRDAASSGSDRVKPSSGSSAMDRLGGGASPGSGAAGGGGSDGGRTGAKSSSGAAGTMPGGSPSGGGAGVSTFRSPSNMVAPPPSGGLR